MTASSCSSLTSLAPSSCSSLSSLDPLTSSDDNSEDDRKPNPKEDQPLPLLNSPGNDSEDGGESAVEEGRPPFSIGTSPQSIAPPTLGKRRRKRNSEQGRLRRAQQQKKTPRKRAGSKRERIDRSKVEQAQRQAVDTDQLLENLVPSLNVSEEEEVFDLETAKSKGCKVIQWDGM